MLESGNKMVSNSHDTYLESKSPKIQSNSFKEKSATIISHLDLNSIGQAELSFIRSDSSSSKSSPKSKSSSKSKSSKSSNSSKSNDYEAECELFIQIVTDIFNPDEIGDASIYSVVGDMEEHGASDEQSIVAVINIFNKDTEEICASFEFLSDEKLITITEINRCSDEGIEGSGTHIINNIKKAYFTLKSELKTEIKMVIESDQSEIIVFIDEKKDFIGLSYLYLFSKGQSWYNKLGFREANFDENSELINDFIHRQANSVFKKEDIKKLKDYHVLLNEDDSVQQVYARIMRRIREISNNPSKKILKEFTFFREFSIRTRVFFLFETITEEQRKLFQRKFSNITFQDTVGLGRHPSTFKKSHKARSPAGLLKRAKKSSFKKRLLRSKKKKSSFKKKMQRNKSQNYTFKKSHKARSPAGLLKIAKKSSFKKRLLRTKSKKNKK